MRFQREKAADILGDIRPLIRAHYDEISADKDIPLAPDFTLYLEADNAGILRCYTARDDDGLMIGYAIFFVRKAAHYRDSLQAVEDVLFLQPSHRRGGIGIGLIRYAENALREEGVQKVWHHVKVKHPALGQILERMGYEVVELNYAKRIG